MEYSMVTIQDCIDMQWYKNKSVIINDGKAVGFVHEDG